jgi:hypothetical protein
MMYVWIVGHGAIFWRRSHFIVVFGNFRHIKKWSVIGDNRASTGASPLPIFDLDGKWNGMKINFRISPVGAMPPCSPLLREPQIIFDRKIPNFINRFGDRMIVIDKN